MKSKKYFLKKAKRAKRRELTERLKNGFGSKFVDMLRSTYEYNDINLYTGVLQKPIQQWINATLKR